MCDRHNANLDHFCTEHEKRICSQCATEEHSQTPCDSMPVSHATRFLISKTETTVEELKRMKSVSQSILDGNRQEYSLQAIAEAEAKFDKYVETMKQKFVTARKSVKPFAELTREELWKLKAVATKRLPNPVPKRDGDDDAQQVDDLLNRLTEIRKQAKNAKEALQALPNYVEVTVDADFLESLKFEGFPVHVTRNGETGDVFEEMNDSMSSVTTERGAVYLIEKSKFTLEHCVDMVMMEEYFIASVGDSIHKRDHKHMTFRQGLSIPGADKLCVIGETTEVAVLQKVGFISVIQTNPNLVLLYRLMCDQPYLDMSYLESVPGKGDIPAHSPVFIVCHNIKDYILIDYVDLIQARTTKYPGKPPKFHVSVKNLANSSSGKNKSRFRGATKVCALHGKYILVGASKGVSCLNKGGHLIWTIDIYEQISHIMTHNNIVYVCVENENRIMTVSRQGQVIQDNILPTTEFTPERLNAFNDIILVKILGKPIWIFYKEMTEL